ncbi:hypothetical protein [Streptomyces sp. NPDC040750]|uniref:hypothetical protein n=1 Tax=Streptomyces sp. NPDC040750 TaxID=3154491 RepID=UPI0033DB7BEB
MAERKSSSVLTAPLRGAASVLRAVPGAGTVSRAAEETLDKVGAVSPRGRRMAVYTGAGLLGVAGVVEWPVALAGAAVAWLTQPRPSDRAGEGTGGIEPPHDLGTAALRSGHGTAYPGHTPQGDVRPDGSPTRPLGAEPSGHAEAYPVGRPSDGKGAHGKHGKHGKGSHAKGVHGKASEPTASEHRQSPGPLGPTARPDRTTL